MNYVLRPSKDSSKGTIVVRVRTQIYDIRISTDFIIPIKQWNPEMQLLRCYNDTSMQPSLGGISYAELTKRMFELKQFLDYADEEDLTRDFVREHMMRILHAKEPKQQAQVVNIKPTFMEFVEQFIKDCRNGTIKCFRSNNKISARTIDGYSVVYNKLREYENRHHVSLGWDDITLQWLRLWKRDLSEDGYSTNYIAHLVAIQKRMMSVARDMRLTTCDDFTLSEYGASWEAVDNIYLTHDMLDELWQADLMDVASISERIRMIPDKEDRRKAALVLANDSLESLQGAKDLFIVGCLTGQRISDYKRINIGLICTLRDGRQYIDITQKKTSKQVFIPLDKRVNDILDKYNGNLPELSDQKLNDKLKNIGLLMGWTHTTVIPKKKGGMKKFYEAMVSHTARRTFATLAYEDGVPASAIMSITGHSTESTFRKYIKTSAKDKAILAAQEFFNVRKA